MNEVVVKFFCLIILFIASGVSILPAQTNAEISVTATNEPKVAAQTPRAPTRIDSDTVDFDLNSRRAIYRGDVRVNDPQMKLTCAWLAVDLPPAGGRPDHIVARTNVIVDATDEKGQAMHATSDEAVYAYNVQNGATNETVTFTGHAKIENAQGWLTGEPIIWNRANNSLTATNQHMIFRQNLNGAMAETNSPARKTKKPAAPR